MALVVRKGREEDCEAVRKLILELAIYERAEKEMELTTEQLIEDGFGENSIYGLFVAEEDENLIGIALYYEKYSTWKGRCLYLEDLVVTASHRGIGAGKALFKSVIQEAKRRNSGRMEWQVLDWNQPAIDFYAAYEAELDNTWVNGRFTREQLMKM